MKLRLRHFPGDNYSMKTTLNINKIKDLYNNDKLTLREIANFYRVSHPTILTFMKLNNLSRRIRSEAEIGKKLSKKHIELLRNSRIGHGTWNKGLKMSKETCKKMSENCWTRGLSPELHPNWQGGLSKLGYPYYFNSLLKRTIRNRDNRTCQCCDLKEDNHFKGTKNIDLTVHHIDYNKENCKENNLITLCWKCNIKVNFNRDYWYAYFCYILDNN